MDWECSWSGAPGSQFVLDFYFDFGSSRKQLHKRRIAETPEIDIQHISDLPNGTLVRTQRRLEEWILFEQTRVSEREIRALVAVLDGAAVLDANGIREVGVFYFGLHDVVVVWAERCLEEWILA